MSITPLPPAPAPTDSTQQFNEKAFDWVASLGDFTTETNALAVAVTNDKNTTASIVGAAQVSANAAASSATAAAGSASAALGHASAAAANTNAPLWVSGTTYAAGALVYSALTGRTYRRKTSGSGTTDPSADTANWTALFLEIQTQRPTIRPSLLLDFANTKRLDPRITFARASSARFYDGRTVSKAEENLVIRSQEFDNAAWVTNGTTKTANSTTAPDGTLTADSIVEFTTNSVHLISQDVSLSGICVLSVFAKLGLGSRFLTIGVSRAFNQYVTATFDLSNETNTQTLVSGAYTGQSATITPVAEGFYRCTLTVTTDTANLVRLGFSNTGTPSTDNRGFGADFLGVVTNSIILWGAQLEQRSSVTAYTPTTTQPITNYIPVLQSAADNVARFDHNPITGESLGFLVEEIRTNLLLRSEEFDDAAWGKGNSTITANTIVSPAGTLTGDKLVEDGNNNTHLIIPASNISFTSGTSYTQSIYAKAAERTFLQLRTTVTNTFSASFNLSTGVASEITANTTASVVAVGNGWYRCSITFTAPSTLATTTVRFGSMLNATTQSYQGDGYSGVYIWGAQLEAGAFPTSYIPTVASQVTRAADAASMTGANFSQWYRQDEGTLYGEAVVNTGSVITSAIFSIDNNSTTERFQIKHNGISTGVCLVVNNGAVQAQISAVTAGFPLGVGTKIAGAIAKNNFAVVTNGTTVNTDTDGLMPSPNQATIGFGAGTNSINGTIKKIAFYPQRLSNANLVALTS
jgi:hypothetical protein